VATKVDLDEINVDLCVYLTEVGLLCVAFSRLLSSRNVFNVFAIMSSVEAPAVLLLIPMLNAKAVGRQRGTLGLFLCLGAAPSSLR